MAAVILLAGTLVTLVPQLNGADVPVADSQAASAPEVPTVRSGLVQIIQTDDVEYVVQPGDTLGAIAREYRVDYTTLAQYNNIASPYTIAPGQRLLIPGTLSLRSEQQ